MAKTSELDHASVWGVSVNLHDNLRPCIWAWWQIFGPLQRCRIVLCKLYLSPSFEASKSSQVRFKRVLQLGKCIMSYDIDVLAF